MVTGNPKKAAEVAAFFRGCLAVNHVALEIPELRTSDITHIARDKTEFAFRHLHSPVIVDDTGLFIDALHGFPGPYAAYVQETIGNAGILRLLEGTESREARFITCIGYADAQGTKIFSGVLEGRITASARGCNGFGYDPIFAVDDRTLAELPDEEKNRISHRALALASFRDWFIAEKLNQRRDTNG